MGGDERLFGEIAQFFIEDSPGLLQDMHHGLETGNAMHVALAAHTLKGLASNFDADEVVQIALQLETLGRSGQLGGAEELLDRLQSRVANLNDHLSVYGVSSED